MAASDRKLTPAEYARYARQTDDELCRACTVQVFRATGPGGQGVNTTDSAVRMTHGPTGVTVVARESRSQLRNRETCLKKIRAILERRSRVPKKRRKTKVPRHVNEKRLAAKRLRAERKESRRRIW